jgi:hypothetical protein
MPTYLFKVSGRGYFPLDMLRYGCCWPSDMEAVVALTNNVETVVDFHKVIRVVSLTSGQEPDAVRRASFGWTVRDVKKL